MRKMEKGKILDEDELGIGKKVFKYLLIGVVIVILITSFYIIPAGKRGVLLTFGKPSMEAMGEGLHFKVPIVQKIVKISVQTQKYEASASAASQDLQIVTSVIATNYHLDSSSVPSLYKDVGLEYATKVIMPLEQEVVKSITAKFTAEQLITRREEVRVEIKQLLTERLAARGILVEEVSIVNFDFSPQFNAAIESKVTAEQNALAAKNKLLQVDYEAQQRVTQAKGEADAIAIQAQAINSQGGRDYVQLQAIGKWNGQLPTFVAGGNNMPFIGDIGNLLTSSAK